MAKRQRNKASTIKQKTNAKAADSMIRIIGGAFRGRKLPVLTHEGLRPTSDRVKETVFNWLQFDVPGGRCLDLFAGSGSLSLEAVSRGAQFVQSCELYPAAARQILANIAALNAQSKLNVFQGSAFDWLRQADDAAFDVVFIDPPFFKEMTTEVLQLLFSNSLVHDDSVIYLEIEKQLPLPPLPKDWNWVREKSTSQVRYGIARMQNISTND